MPNLSTADQIAVGSTLADRVYVGTSLVWEPPAPPTDGFGIQAFGTSSFGGTP